MLGKSVYFPTSLDRMGTLPLNAGIYWDLLIGSVPFSIAAPLLWNALSRENRQVLPLSHLEVCKVANSSPKALGKMRLESV